MILVDLRAVLWHLEVRVAGTPSPYPNLFTFPNTYNPAERHPELIPSRAILGYQDFASNSLELVTDTGVGYEGVGPELWYERNICHLPDNWEECERRILRLPRGSTSADHTLDAHQRDIVNRILLHGADDGRVDPTVTRAPELS
jgi:hypothetical protein